MDHVTPCSIVVTPNVTKHYLFGKASSGHARRRKISREDVEDIRRWVRTDGWGLTPLQQARHLVATEYPYMHWATIRDCILNISWFDPTYDRLMPLNIPHNLPPEWLGWFLSLILMWRMMCAVSSSGVSAADAPRIGISN